MARSRLLLLLFIGCGSVAGASPGAIGYSASAAPSDPRELERAVAQVERRQRELQGELQSLDRVGEQARVRATAFGRAYVRATRAGLLPVAGGFDAFVEHAVRIERLRNAAARELRKEKDSAAQRLALRRELTDVGSRLAVLRASQQAMAQAHTALLAAADRAAAFERAFSSSIGHTAVYGSGAGPLDPTLVANGFAGLKGRLPFPIAGRTEISRGSRPGIDGRGLELRAPVGTAVLAVFPGRVAFADEYGAYGRTVILDHGSHYFTVSAGLDELGVAVGDELPAGARIGAVGLGPNGPGLYFEIRLGGGTLDPREWMGL